MSIDWLWARAPGFNDLTDLERTAIVDFSLLWSLFEARILNSAGSASRIYTTVGTWKNDGTLQADAYAEELMHFRRRYFTAGDFTYHFGHLRIRQNDREALVRAVIEGSNNDSRDCVAAVLIIILRYRNNLFHGIKWQYQLADQFDNFTNANSVLMKALEHHGQLIQS